MSQNIIKNKKDKVDLRIYYNLYVEIGLAVTLGILLVLFKMPFHPNGKGENFSVPQQETVKMQKVVQTRQKNLPPPPPTPQVPVAVPNDQVINDAPIDLNSELNVNAPISLPTPPPPSQNSNAKKSNQQQVFIVVENMPKLIGGLRGLQAKIRYPKLAREAGIEGTVYIQFVVNRKGRVVDPKVIRGIGGGCDREALKVVKEARFRPGLQRGRPVNVRYSLPIVFKLED